MVSFEDYEDLSPEEKLEIERELYKEKQLEAKLKSLKDSMTDEEIEALIIKTKELKNYQETPSTPEELETIPLLEIEDINESPRPFIYNEEKRQAIGEHTGKVYQIGDKVKIRVANASKLMRQIDFEIC